ncbi:MAG: heme biosynthesis protein HemY [Marinovum sp.]|nr:heme biosynthesis protein HemY [Marinovum sp.]
MLWSLTKIIGFVVVVGALAIGAGFLLESADGMRIVVGGSEYTFSAFQSVMLFVVLLVALWVTLKVLSLTVAFLKVVNGDETALSRYFDRNRERKGYKMLAEGLLALASGEGKLAMAKAAKAEKHLGRPELTNLLTAQAAEMSGDRAKAEETYKKLVQDDLTRFVGVRGILKQKLAAGETDTALKLAERAFAIKPKHEETQDTLLKLQAQSEDWAGARKTLNAKLKSGTMPRDVHRRRDAVLAMAEGQEAMAAGDMDQAHTKFIEANKMSPDFVPAAAAAARSQIQKGQKRVATRLLKKVWTKEPHPDLAAAFAEIEPEETPAARLKRFQPLLNMHADHPEVMMTRAELNLAAEDFPAARRALGKLVEEDPTVRSLTIMAAIERGEGAEDSLVRGWLTRALSASRGPQWICDVCNTAAVVWSPICEVCGGFDTLTWRTAPAPEQSKLASSDVLPLLVGADGVASESNIVVVEDADVVAPANTPEAPQADDVDTPEATVAKS